MFTNRKKNIRYSRIKTYKFTAAAPVDRIYLLGRLPPSILASPFASPSPFPCVTFPTLAGLEAIILTIFIDYMCLLIHHFQIRPLKRKATHVN